MAKVTTYKNSKFASFLSILGYFLIVGGIYLLFNDEPAIGAIILVAAIALKFLAAFISKRRSRKDAKMGLK